MCVSECVCASACVRVRVLCRYNEHDLSEFLAAARSATEKEIIWSLSDLTCTLTRLKVRTTTVVLYLRRGYCFPPSPMPFALSISLFMSTNK